MLDEGTKEKFKSSLIMELLSKKYPGEARGRPRLQTVHYSIVQ
jgi:hypothetical protein